LERTGGVDLAVNCLLHLVGEASPHVLLASLFVLTAAIGLFISNTATAVLMAPIALALADAPIAQTFAVTGSVDQRGQIQTIGGVNEKIEGFFDACHGVGLNGNQGVVIPAPIRAT
jgi:hypothetical protein